VLDKVVADTTEALAGVEDGSTVMISGFGGAGAPVELIHALIDQGARDLVVVSNNVGNGNVGLAALIEAGRVRKIICSFPRGRGSTAFAERYRRGEIELELVPQGTLAERIRAAGAGVPAFYTPTAVATPLANGKEHRDFGGRLYVLETALPAEVALIKCRASDTVGNLVYNKTARNFGPIMAMAARLAIAQCSTVVSRGMLDPEVVITPGIFIDRVVLIERPIHEDVLVEQGAAYL
jgi:3-oxoadipate CoA-transferase, alpha subunit